MTLESENLPPQSFTDFCFQDAQVSAGGFTVQAHPLAYTSSEARKSPYSIMICELSDGKKIEGESLQNH